MRSLVYSVLGLFLGMGCEPSDGDRGGTAGASSETSSSSSEASALSGIYTLDFDEIARRHGKISRDELETEEGQHRLEEARDMLTKMSGTLTLSDEGTFAFDLTLDEFNQVTEGKWEPLEQGFRMTSQVEGDTHTSRVLPEGEFWIMREGEMIFIFRKSS